MHLYRTLSLPAHACMPACVHACMRVCRERFDDCERKLAAARAKLADQSRDLARATAAATAPYMASNKSEMLGLFKKLRGIVQSYRLTLAGTVAGKLKGEGTNLTELQLFQLMHAVIAALEAGAPPMVSPLSAEAMARSAAPGQAHHPVVVYNPLSTSPPSGAGGGPLQHPPLAKTPSFNRPLSGGLRSTQHSLAGASSAAGSGGGAPHLAPLTNHAYYAEAAAHLTGSSSTKRLNAVSDAAHYDALHGVSNHSLARTSLESNPAMSVSSLSLPAVSASISASAALPPGALRQKRSSNDSDGAGNAPPHAFIGTGSRTGLSSLGLTPPVGPGRRGGTGNGGMDPAASASMTGAPGGGGLSAILAVRQHSRRTSMAESLAAEDFEQPPGMSMSMSMSGTLMVGRDARVGESTDELLSASLRGHLAQHNHAHAHPGGGGGGGAEAATAGGDSRGLSRQHSESGLGRSPRNASRPSSGRPAGRMSEAGVPLASIPAVPGHLPALAPR